VGRLSETASNLADQVSRYDCRKSLCDLVHVSRRSVSRGTVLAAEAMKEEIASIDTRLIHRPHKGPQPAFGG